MTKSHNLCDEIKLLVKSSFCIILNATKKCKKFLLSKNKVNLSQVKNYFDARGEMMEQLHVTTTNDNERVFQILTDLLRKDKEFQIMITVPSAKQQVSQGVILHGASDERPSVKAHDLEQDVTDMIHV